MLRVSGDLGAMSVHAPTHAYGSISSGGLPAVLGLRQACGHIGPLFTARSTRHRLREAAPVAEVADAWARRVDHREQVVGPTARDRSEVVVGGLINEYHGAGGMSGTVGLRPLQGPGVFIR
jgi:hypothetical protein